MYRFAAVASAVEKNASAVILEVGVGTLPLVVAVNYCGIPTVTQAQLAGIVVHMVSVGADPEVKDAQGQNLFDRAKYACPPEVMKALGG